MNILLHICCAPCLAGTLLELEEAEDKYGIEGLFYNPNIHPLVEFKNRESSLKEYIAKEHPEIVIHYIDYNPKEYFRAVQDRIEPQDRCYSCWQLRLERTAQFAQENNIPAFTSTLLVSPYQSQEKLKELGEKAAQKYGVKFIYRNFRRFYSRGRKIAKELNLYRQNYCGCLFSEWERYEKKIKN